MTHFLIKLLKQHYLDSVFHIIKIMQLASCTWHLHTRRIWHFYHAWKLKYGHVYPPITPQNAKYLKASQQKLNFFQDRRIKATPSIHFQAPGSI